MKKLLLLSLALLLVLAGCRKTGEPNTPLPEKPAETATLAESFMEHLYDGDYAGAYALANDTLQHALGSESGLATTMTQVALQTGDYVSHDAPAHNTQGGYDVFDYPTTFENGRFVTQVSVDASGVAGLFFIPHLDVAERYIEGFLSGDFEAVYAASDPMMQTAYNSVEGAAQVWQGILAQTGDYIGREAPHAGLGDSVTFVFPADFAVGRLNITVVVGGANGLVTGFSVLPETSNDNNRNAEAIANGPTPSDDLPAGVAEQDILINVGGEHPLYGKLTYPEGITDPIPAIVLVHGSGAHDMDETIFENTPLKDIAYGLAQQGVAALRYHKVTYAYPADFDNATITIEMETVDDAIAAKQALLDQADIDLSHVYVAGHSLGGLMAPRIASEGDYDGMIILAGSARSLVDIGLDQARYLLPISGLTEEQVEAELAEYDRMYAEAQETLKLPAAELAGKTVLGFPAIYVHSMENPDRTELIRRLDMPMLILQGGKDFQVYADRDYELYKTVTDGLSDVTMKLYPTLNHLFMPSHMDIPDTSEYQTPSEVDPEVIADIATWLKARG